MSPFITTDRHGRPVFSRNRNSHSSRPSTREALAESERVNEILNAENQTLRRNNSLLEQRIWESEQRLNALRLERGTAGDLRQQNVEQARVIEHLQERLAAESEAHDKWKRKYHQLRRRSGDFVDLGGVAQDLHAQLDQRDRLIRQRDDLIIVKDESIEQQRRTIRALERKIREIKETVRAAGFELLL